LVNHIRPFGDTDKIVGELKQKLKLNTNVVRDLLKKKYMFIYEITKKFEIIKTI
jgi:hypothetical protein